MLLVIVTGVTIIGDDHILADFKGRDGAANLLDIANRLVPKAPRDIGGESCVERHFRRWMKETRMAGLLLTMYLP